MKLSVLDIHIFNFSFEVDRPPPPLERVLSKNQADKMDLCLEIHVLLTKSLPFSQ